MIEGFENYFSIQIFFIILRETLETAIIISVLLSFINQRSHKHEESIDSTQPQQPQLSQHHIEHLEKVQRKLRLQVWIGAILGLVICFIIGLIFIFCFYIIGKDFWSYTERVWEGVFSILSSIIITIMGIGLLRINKVMKLKWWIKLGDAYKNDIDLDDQNNEAEEEIAKFGQGELEDEDDLIANYGGTRSSAESNDIETVPLTGSSTSAVPIPNSSSSPSPSNSSSSALSGKLKHKQRFTKKYFLAILPLVTTLREGLEAVVFIGGIGMSQPLSSIPLSIICGISFGTIIGYTLYKGGNKLSLQYFLIFLTCFLYIVSAGLMSRGVWFLELEAYVRKCGGLDVSETGSGPGSYDVATSIWHVNCCNGLTDGWWMVLNAIFGWTNSATYGSVFTYCAYWALVIVWLEIKLYEERVGVLPLVPIKWQLKRIRKKVRLYELRQQQEQEHQQEQQQQPEQQEQQPVANLEEQALLQ